MRVLVIICLLFIGCKSELSKADKDLLQLQIDIHNQNQDFALKQKAIEVKGEIRKEYLIRGIKDTNLLRKRIDLEVSKLESDWNKPYDIHKDRKLTLESYLQYCKAHDYDPKTYVKYID